jgi:hypothetical protein
MAPADHVQSEAKKLLLVFLWGEKKADSSVRSA